MTTRRLRHWIAVVVLLMLGIASLVLLTPRGDAQASDTVVLRLAVKATDREQAETAAQEQQGVIVDAVTDGRTIWIIEAERPIDATTTIEQQTADLAQSFEASPRIKWAVPANATVDGSRFFVWADSAEPTVQATRFFVWGEGGVSDSFIGLDPIEFSDLDRIHGQVRGEGVSIALLDSGVDIDHPMLASRLLDGIDLVDGDTDVRDERDGLDNDNDGVVDEAYGHGTYVAGVIAQVAPGAKIVPIRVLDADGIGDVQAVVDGIDEALDRGVDIINMSFGTDQDYPALRAAVERAEANGVLVIGASGNQGTEAPQYPAAYPDVLSVAPYDSVRNEVAVFGNLSAWVDVSALGVNTFSSGPESNYGSFSGSSIAAPIVAAQAALLVDADPTLTNEQVRARIRQTSAVPPGSNIRKTTYGLVNIGASLGLPAPEPVTEDLSSLGSSCTIRDGVAQIATTAALIWLRRDGKSIRTTDQGASRDSFAISDFDPSAAYSVAGWRNGIRVRFGCQQVLPGCLGNQVWVDANGDGRRDSGEPLAPGVTVELLPEDGSMVLQSTATNESGRYTFCEQPGLYKVRFVAPAGFDFTIPNAVGEGRDSDPDPATGVTIQTFEIISNTTNNRVDAGLVAEPPPPNPEIDLVKRVEGDDANSAPGPEFNVGDVVEITYDVTNTGNVDLTNVVVDDATLGVIACPQDTLGVGETFQCVVTETLHEMFVFFSPIFMEAEARGSFQSEIVRDDDPINFTVVEPLGISECSFSARNGVLSVITDQNPAFLNADYLVRQGGESSPSLILSADDAQLRLDFRGEFYELAWFGLPPFTSFDVTVTPVFDSGSSSPAKIGATTLCNRGTSPIAVDVDRSGAVERIEAVVDFDFGADGEAEVVSEWFGPSEGILFDSTIDGALTGEHLFGDQGGEYRDGYAKLAVRDLNADGMVSGAELNGLALWTDINTNGVLDAGETMNLAAVGITSLSTSHTNYLSTATLADGSTMVTEDLWFPVTAGASVAEGTNVLRNLGISLAAIALAVAGFVVARRAQRRRHLDNELTQLLNDQREPAHS